MTLTFSPICSLLLISVLSVATLSTVANAESTQNTGNPLPHIVELQQGLKELGYDPGVADGIMGTKTSDAIRAFQRDHNLTEDGEYSTFILIQVNVQVEIARKEATPEGRKRKEEQDKLLALNDAELISLVQKSERTEAARLLDLIGERALDLPARVILGLIVAPHDSPEEDAEASFLLFTDMLSELWLRTLLYDFTDLNDGISQYQQDLGEKVTGELTMRQFGELARRKARFYETPVYLPVVDKIRIYTSDGYASVEGTWVLEGEQLAWPIQTSKITCRLDTNQCGEIQALLNVPDIDDDADGYQLMVDSRSWRIISWDSSEIIARDPGTCRTSVLTLSLQSNEVDEIIRNNEGKDCTESPLRGSSLEKPRMARLVPGYELSSEFWNERKKSYTDFTSSKFRKQVIDQLCELGAKEEFEIPGLGMQCR